MRAIWLRPSRRRTASPCRVPFYACCSTSPYTHIVRSPHWWRGSRWYQIDVKPATVAVTLGNALPLAGLVARPRRVAPGSPSDRLPRFGSHLRFKRYIRGVRSPTSGSPPIDAPKFAAHFTCQERATNGTTARSSATALRNALRARIAHEATTSAKGEQKPEPSALLELRRSRRSRHAGATSQR
jgi:hypothetical protein